MNMQQQDLHTPGPVFISFSGKKQVGKDTATEFARKKLVKSGKTVEISAFAEPLKDIAINVLGINRSLVYGSNEHKETITHIVWDNFPTNIRDKYSLDNDSPFPALRKGPMTVREVLQVLGTDIFRQMFDDNVWAKAPFNRHWNADVVILTDCRFPNEKEQTELHEGLVVRVSRDTGMIDNHPSETALDGAEFETYYCNDGSLEELDAFVTEFLKEQNLING